VVLINPVSWQELRQCDSDENVRPIATSVLPRLTARGT
jgi:hypothetical protein